MSLMARIHMILGALFSLLSVALGAFGAHVLRQRLEPSDMAIFQTAVHYQGYHGLALLVVGAWFYYAKSPKQLSWAGSWFTAGIVVFSGSLYLLVAIGARWFGAITPIGGVCFLLGWISVMAGALRLPASPSS